MPIATTTTTSGNNRHHCHPYHHQQQSFAVAVAAGQLVVVVRMVDDLCGTWYLVGFPVTRQHTATYWYTVDAHHHHHQGQASESAGAGAQLVVVVVVVVLDLRMVVVEVSGTCYLVPGMPRTYVCLLFPGPLVPGKESRPFNMTTKLREFGTGLNTNRGGWKCY